MTDFLFFVLILYPAALLNLFIISNSVCMCVCVCVCVCVYSLGFYVCKIMSSASGDSFTSFQVWMPFISLSRLIALVRTSSTTLNRSGESRHLCLVLDFRGKGFSLSSLSMMLDVLFFTYDLYHIENSFLFLDYWVFYNEKVLDLSNAFSAWIEVMMWVFPFILLMWYITLIDFHILSHLCIPGINYVGSWCIILLICCWILFASILLRIFASMSVVFCSCHVFVWLWYQGNAGLLESGNVHSFSTSGKFEKD